MDILKKNYHTNTSDVFKTSDVFQFSEMKNKLSLFRKTGIAEGISLLVLLCIAMPLKYFFDQPMAVKVVGWIHGILFIAFLYMAWNYGSSQNKKFSWYALAFVAAFFPLGTFLFDRKLKREEVEI